MQRFISYFEQRLGTKYSSLEKKSLSRLLLRQIGELSSSQIYSDKDRIFSAEKLHELCAAIDRLALNEPIQYILKETEFCGLSLHLSSDVLIPRPETEELVIQVQKDFMHAKTDLHMLDIGTGSGCIAVSLAHLLPNSKITAFDVSPLALKIAQENAQLHQVQITFSLVDILQFKIAVDDEKKFDAIISNPPYVMNREQEAMEANVLEYEPSIALFVEDQDPLIFYRAIGQLALRLLKPSGTLYFEINSHLGIETSNLLTSLGFGQVTLTKDIAGKDRFIKAKL